MKYLQSMRETIAIQWGFKGPMFVAVTAQIIGLFFDSAGWVHGKYTMAKWMSEEFDDLTAGADGYFLVVQGSTRALFRHGYFARYGIYTLPKS